MKLLRAVGASDVVGLVGIAMLAAGLGMISIPVMLIVVGGLLVIIAVIGAWRKHG
jgi:hypothetical protein